MRQAEHPYRSPAKLPAPKHIHDWRWEFEWSTPSDSEVVWFCKDCRQRAGFLWSEYLSFIHGV